MDIAPILTARALLLVSAVTACHGSAGTTEASESPQAGERVVAPPAQQTASALTPARTPSRHEAPRAVDSEERVYDTTRMPVLKSPVAAAGIELGMTADQVLSALQARGIDGIIYYRTQRLSAEGDLSRVETSSERSRVFPLEQDRFLTEINTRAELGNGEEFTIDFARPPEPNVVIAVSFEVDYQNNMSSGRLETSLLAGVDQQYGKAFGSAEEASRYSNTVSRSYRWLYGGVDCNEANKRLAFGRASSWALRSPSYDRELPEPYSCATSLILRTNTTKLGEFAGVVGSYSLTLGNDGALFINQGRHEGFVKARKDAWLEKRQAEISAGTPEPRL
jgi:hypothetical protein